MKKLVLFLAFINSCSYINNLKSFNSKQSFDENRKKDNCYNCEGNGKTVCPRCKGGKKLHNFTLKGYELIKCERCKAKGFSVCDKCKGSGLNKKANKCKKNI